MLEIKNIVTLGTIVNLQGNVEVQRIRAGISNLKYSVSKKSPIAFHNGSNYDYNCVIKELAGKF